MGDDAVGFFWRERERVWGRSFQQGCRALHNCFRELVVAIISGADMNALAQIGVLESMPEGKKGGRRLTKQGQQDIDRIAKEIFDSKQ
jgi:ribosomal protein S19E (S16A)